MPIRGRLSSRQREADEGFAMIEVMVALLILSVAVFALVTVTYSSMTTASKARVRESAIATMNSQSEFLRANGYPNIVIKPNSGLGGATVPSTYTYDGVTGPIVVGVGTACDALDSCFRYQKEVTTNGQDFLVTTVIVGVDDLADGKDADDDDGQTIDYKKIFLTVASTDATPAFSYTTSTIIRDTGLDPTFTTTQGIQVLLVDENGVRLTDEGLGFTIDIAAANVADDPVDEGEYVNLDMDTGSYTCVISNSATSAAWHPAGNPSSNLDSFACNVTASTVTPLTRTWQAAPPCTVDASTTGSLSATVTHAIAGTPISGASVDPAPLDGQSTNPAAATTNASGIVVFSGLKTGDYSMAITESSFNSETIGEVCVFNGSQTAQPVSLSPVAGSSTTIIVPVTYTGSGFKQFKIIANSVSSSYLSISQFQTVNISVDTNAGTFDVKVYCLKAGVDTLKKTIASATHAPGSTWVKPAYTTNAC